MAAVPDSVAIDVLKAHLGKAYERLDAAGQARYVELVQSVRRPEDVALDAQDTGDGRWTITICTSDCLGALSVIAGLFTAYRLDILSADIFTLRFPKQQTEHIRRRDWPPRRSSSSEPPAPSRPLLDVFHIRAVTAPTPELWRSFREELSGLVSLLVDGQSKQAQEAVIDRVSEAFRTGRIADAKLLPMSIDLTNDPSSPYTKVTVRSADTPGFLFAFTNALAGFTVNVERAEIRTLEGEVQDTLWVTDIAGQPIVGEERIHELRVATILVKQFTYLLPRSANPGQALRQFNALISQILSLPRWTAELGNLESLSVLETLAALMGVSRFLWEDFLRMQHENLFPVLVDVPSLGEARTEEELTEELGQRLSGLESEAARVEALNAFKDREMFRIDLRHIIGRSDFNSFAAELTQLAEVTVEMAADLSMAALYEQFGEPTLDDGRSCPWCICALGKFGGRDLGFGSDLELIFVYEGEGTTKEENSILNSEFFTRFVQSFKSVIRARQEGVFEIDLRLRPFGGAGALASSLDGFAHYYSFPGDAEQFERMALVRLRPVAGDPTLGVRVLQRRDIFVYSDRPLDIENIRHLRHRQATELVPPGKVNAKYSSGGLVDIEYFVQARQIVAGATDSRVRVTNTLEGIARLVEGGHLSSELARSLRDSYMFLRQLIDALRVVRGNAKDLTIPPSQSREFAYLAHRLRFAAPEELEEAIAARMAFARTLWSEAASPSA